ncbi:hypothetical protein [Streptomyces venezuelae]|uniref:hypothetical protein n=1 Tax=Streptomyces venezuelae TaxID=54571 RepID=UPI003650517D
MPAPRTMLSTMALAVACLAAGTATTATALSGHEAGPAAAPPAAAPSASAPPVSARTDSTRTASAITELSAEEISTGTTARVKVSGRLVEGSTLTFPLARIPLTVQVTDAAAGTPARCHARTTARGTFSCSVAVTAGSSRSVKAAFAGNELFAPSTSTTSIGSTDEGALPADPLLPEATAPRPDAAATPATVPAPAATLAPAATAPAAKAPNARTSVKDDPTPPAAPTPPELPTAPAVAPAAHAPFTDTTVWD